MDIKLHIGAHRTATTTFQNYLWINRAELAKRGITCWTPRRTRDGLLRGMMRHPALISVEDERQALRSIGRVRIEANRLQRLGQRALLVSEENIMGTMRNNLADMRLYALLQERLRRFVPAFEGYRLEIGLGIRSYEDYWASILAYQMSRGGAKPGMDLLDYLTTQPRRWRTLIRDIAEIFPKADIVVWPFEGIGKQSNRVLEVLCPGTSHDLFFDGISRNYTADVARLNEILSMRGETRYDAGPQTDGQRWMPFTEEQTSVLRSEYRRDIAWLKAGAEGLARYTDGRQTPAFGSDRAREVIPPYAQAMAPDRGQRHGNQEGMGGTRAG